jgi:phage-related protein
MRNISWIKAALKDFTKFPVDVQVQMATGLEVVGAGEYPDFAKPLIGIESGVFELAMPWKGDAWRVVYAIKIDRDIWVLHAFQKKSTSGIKTPKVEIELIKNRIKALRSRI